MTSVQRIHAILKDMIRLFDEAGCHGGWNDHFRSALTISDSEALCRKVLGWFGGMGSLNDFRFSPLNGHKGSPQQMRNWQLKLDTCLSDLWAMCQTPSLDDLTS